MALGKPVVCFVKESLRNRYPHGFPVVMTDQNGLATTLAGLVEYAPKLRALGVEGRKYIEAYHDARSVGAELIEIYSDLQKHRDGNEESERRADCRHWKASKHGNKELEPCAR